MAGETGSETHSLRERLREAPWRFDFFQAARRLECASAERPRIGHSQHPKDDHVRFCQEPSLAFAPCTVAADRDPRGAAPPRLFVNFLGLLGPNGPFPLHLTEYARERELHHKDMALSRFLDVFNHRMISLFYRAWACNQQAVNFERGDGDRFAVYIGSLFGIGLSSLRHRDAVPDVAKLHYSGRLVCQTKHPAGLCAILREYFGLASEIVEFVGRWLRLPEDCCCRLGESPDTGSLGTTAIVGSRIWECQQSFRIRFGPMGLVDYERMLPNGDSFRRLVAWEKNYVDDEFQWEAQLILRKEEVPETKLGQFGMLGWTTWLKSQPFERDADDLVLQPTAA